MWIPGDDRFSEDPGCVTGDGGAGHHSDWHHHWRPGHRGVCEESEEAVHGQEGGRGEHCGAAAAGHRHTDVRPVQTRLRTEMPQGR